MWKKGTFINLTKYFYTKHCWHYWLFNNVYIVVFSSWTKTNGLIQLRRYPAMWEYGWDYHVEWRDIKISSFGCGVMVDFKKSSWAILKDKNIIEGNLQYVGKIQEIIELDYRSFKCNIFKCRWYEAFETMQRHDTHSGLFSIDSLRYLPEDKDPYVLPIHCEEVVLFSV